MEVTSLHFAAAARTLGDAARQRGLKVPAFRSPPRLPGADRTIRRRFGPSPTVAVRYRHRPWNAVLADLIEGVVVANDLHGPAADACRTALWAALDDDAERVGRPIAAA